MESPGKDYSNGQENEKNTVNNDDDPMEEGVNKTCLPSDQDSQEANEMERDDNTRETDNITNATAQDERVLNMLNLLPRKRPREEEKGRDEMEGLKGKLIKGNGTEDSSVSPPPKVSPSPSKEPSTPPSSLVQIFKKDPDHVLSLLSKAISMDSLALLLKTEHQNNAAQLKALKEKVEKAHSVLSQCAGRRDTLLKSIDEVTKDIQTKRSQLAATREELRELSMQEGQVKQRRDLASQKCSDLRRNVRACRETVQQLHSLYGKKRKGGEKSFKARTAET